ncbi:MAG TPA: hypothetical protein VIJ33_01970 [Solirubrobacteraceae bacterium]
MGSGLVAALEEGWQAIRDHHPELPPAVLITGAGSLGTKRGLRLGHFAAQRWQIGEHEPLAEIFVGGEGLGRGAGPVMATLLHEAAHALAHMRGIKDTSRQGRYHNRRFKALAEELGLHVDHDPRIGWSPTTLPTESAARYSVAIANLERALTAYREGEHSGPAGAAQQPPAVRMRMRAPPSCRPQRPCPGADHLRNLWPRVPRCVRQSA